MSSISVIIPCHNQARYLRTAVDSVLVQTRGDHEIIIVNDASTDNTDALAREIMAENPGRAMTLMSSDKQEGLSAARNAGIKQATGEYILPLDADDFLHPAFLYRTAALLDTRPELDVVAAGRVNFGGHCAVVNTAGDPTLLPLVNQFGYCSLFRKSVWIEVGGYPANFPEMGYEDWEFWLSAWERGAKFHSIPDILWFYRVRAGSMSAGALENHDRLMARMVVRHEPLYARTTVAAATAAMVCSPVEGQM